MAYLSKIFKWLGGWIEKHFPEKITASEVLGDIKRLSTDIVSLKLNDKQNHEMTVDTIEALTNLTERIQKIESEINTIKTIAEIRSRVVGHKLPTRPQT